MRRTVILAAVVTLRCGTPTVAPMPEPMETACFCGCYAGQFAHENESTDACIVRECEDMDTSSVLAQWRLDVNFCRNVRRR